jgi:hypothetical protein
MSTVILDTITGKSTATTITIGSTPVVSASANSMTIRGEGSAQTSIQQGLIKSWVNFEQEGTHASRDSFNISSLTDGGTGVTVPISFTNNMSDANYSGSFYTNAYVQANLAYNGFNNIYAGGFGSRTTSGHGINSYGSANADADNVQVASWGDLA